VTAVRIENLRIEVADNGNDIVDEINLEIEAGEVLGLVGESGSGKTTVGLAVLGHGRKGVKIAAGRITIGDKSILELDEKALRNVRGSLVTYVPQDPGTALNPALRIDKQLMEVLEQHNFGGSAKARKERLQEVMNEVLLPSPLPTPAIRWPAAACWLGYGLCLPPSGHRARRTHHGSGCQHSVARARDRSRPVPYARRCGALRHA
jgi:ABC-type glutathione transport system ATPase component